FSPSQKAFQFAEQLLPHIHPLEKLGPAFFVELIERLGAPEREAVRQNWQWGGRIVKYGLSVLSRFELDKLDTDFLCRLYLDPLPRCAGVQWMKECTVKAEPLGIDFVKVVAFPPAWETYPWRLVVKKYNRTWPAPLAFHGGFSDRIGPWLGDVRRFPAA